MRTVLARLLKRRCRTGYAMNVSCGDITLQKERDRCKKNDNPAR